MLTNIILVVVATFTAPQQIETNPQSILWLLPLTAAIAIVYKATKLHTITARYFLKEVARLFGSIIAFIIIITFALYAIAYLISA